MAREAATRPPLLLCALARLAVARMVEPLCCVPVLPLEVTLEGSWRWKSWGMDGEVEVERLARGQAGVFS